MEVCLSAGCLHCADDSGWKARCGSDILGEERALTVADIRKGGGVMKIIGVDNLARESVADVLVAENVSEFYAETMVDALNKRFCHDYGGLFFKLVPDDYRLSRGMEDLV